MRKIFTLLLVTLMSIGGMQAETFEWYAQKGKVVLSPAEGNPISITGTTNLNSKYNATYVANENLTVDCTKGLKFESGTSIVITTEKVSTIVVVQSTSNNGTKSFKFDGNAATNAVENPSAGDVNVKVYTFENVPAGQHVIGRSAEIGFVYFGVIYPETGLDQLETPTIDVDDNTGVVTMSAPANAEKICYTTDGTIPTAESTVYTEPFTVADNTVVNAISVGDNVVTENSKVASVTVLLKTGVVETPVVDQFNGTFAISCATANTTFEYSLDGETFVPYVFPVTLFETKEIFARASREGWTASTAKVEIVALPEVEKTSTILMGYGSFVRSEDKKILTGKEGDPAFGFSLSMEEKTWESTNKKIVISENESRTAMYGSNGAVVSFTVPENYVVTRITFYSYLANVTNRNAGWSDVAGEKNNSANLVPMGSTNPETPDVRVFNIENGEGVITFNNTGERPNFVMAVDVVEKAPAAPVPTIKVGETVITDGSVDLKEGEVAEVSFELAEGVEVYYNLTETVAPEKAAAEVGLEYTKYTEPIKISKASTLTYYSVVNGVESEKATFTVTGGTTALTEINADANAPVEYFNLQGIRVANPENGVFIRRQGNTVTKVVK